MELRGQVEELRSQVEELRGQVEELEDANHENSIQLNRKEALIKRQRDEITRLQIIEEREADLVRSTKDIMT